MEQLWLGEAVTQEMTVASNEIMVEIIRRRIQLADGKLDIAFLRDVG